jgi:hypothetical protein
MRRLRNTGIFTVFLIVFLGNYFSGTLFLKHRLYTVILFSNLCLVGSELYRLTKKDLNMNLVSAKHEFVFLLDIQMSLNLCLDPSK